MCRTIHISLLHGWYVSHWGFLIWDNICYKHTLLWLSFPFSFFYCSFKHFSLNTKTLSNCYDWLFHIDDSLSEAAYVTNTYCYDCLFYFILIICFSKYCSFGAKISCFHYVYVFHIDDSLSEAAYVINIPSYDYVFYFSFYLFLAKFHYILLCLSLYQYSMCFTLTNILWHIDVPFCSGNKLLIVLQLSLALLCIAFFLLSSFLGFYFILLLSGFCISIITWI